MALRTFHENPHVGGFGGESVPLSLLDNRRKGSKARAVPDGDAFCQILKELVDNAVDACGNARLRTGSSRRTAKSSSYRVKVEIQQHHLEETGKSSSTSDEDEELFKITVTDNGCGMNDIAHCVNAFSSSKQGNNTRAAGRYGIGLTLSLVHAQRLVPQSYACITSGTNTCSNWTRVFCRVNTDKDQVDCRQVEQLPKQNKKECGTCVSLLIPGGPTARASWPRLANYFHQFQLSLDLPCTLEILAPALARVPIFVRDMNQTKSGVAEDVATNEEEYYDEALGDHSLSDTKGSNRTAQNIAKRLQIKRVAQKYLGRSNIPLENVAYSSQPIRLPSTSSSTSSAQPLLQVDMVVCGPDDDEDGDECMDPFQDAAPSSTGSLSTSTKSTLQLVRMVNRIPLLEGAEAAACGICQGLSNKAVWGSFGLQVSPATREEGMAPWGSSMEIQDSEQLASFFKTGNHERFDPREADSRLFRRKSQSSHLGGRLLPARIRLGQVLVVAQIHADPSSLPLPTLSKGRLPVNHMPIDQALQNGLRECLRSVQCTNPTLLLSATQLRQVERDCRYVPAVSWAITRVIGNLKDESLKKKVQETLGEWRTERFGSNCGADGPTTSSIIEERIRMSIDKENSRRRAKEKELLSKRKKANKRKASEHAEETKFRDIEESDTSPAQREKNTSTEADAVDSSLGARVERTLFHPREGNKQVHGALLTVGMNEASRSVSLDLEEKDFAELANSESDEDLSW